MARAVIKEPDAVDGVLTMRNLLDDSLSVKDTVFAGDHVSPTAFRASSLGYCLRRQVFERLGVPRLKGFDRMGNRTLYLGNLIHEGVQRTLWEAGLMIEEELYLEHPDYNLSGHVDALWGGVVQEVDEETRETRKGLYVEYLDTVRAHIMSEYGDDLPIIGSELKSANQYSAEKMFQEGMAFHHGCQAGAYALMARENPEMLPQVAQEYGIEKWQIVVIAKSDMKMPIFDITDIQIDRAEQRIADLEGYWEQRAVPPCTCGQDISWEARYCAYREPTSPDSSPLCCSMFLMEGVSWPEEQLKLVT